MEPCCSSEKENKREESALIEEVLESLRELTRRMNRIESKDLREQSLLALFKYLGTVTDLSDCGVKLAQIRIAVAKKKDELEDKEEMDESSVFMSELGGVLED